MKEPQNPHEYLRRFGVVVSGGYNSNLADLGLTAWMISKLLCMVFKCVLECACTYSVFLHCIVSPQPFHIFCFPTAFIRPVSFSAIVILKETGCAISFSSPKSRSEICHCRHCRWQCKNFCQWCKFLQKHSFFCVFITEAVEIQWN